MATGLKDNGEELYVKRLFRDDTITYPSTIDVLLFDDDADGVGDGGDLSCITTEPSGTYARQTVSLNTSSIAASLNASSNWFSSITDQSFDVSSLNSSQTVRDYGVVGSVQLSGDGSATDHLLWVGDLDQAYDLSNIDTFTLQDSGIILD